MRKIPITAIRTHVQTCQKVTRLQTELPERPAWYITCILEVVAVVVFFTLTDRASTIPITIRGCQSGTWSRRGAKVNESHHGDNPLLRPTGIQIATKSNATLQAMAPTDCTPWCVLRHSRIYLAAWETNFTPETAVALYSTLSTSYSHLTWLIDWLNSRIILSCCQKSSPWSHKVENTIRKRRGKRTTYSPYKVKNGNGTKILGKRYLLPKTRTRTKKNVVTTACGCRGACIWYRRTKQKKRSKTNVSPEKDNMTSPRRIQLRATCG